MIKPYDYQEKAISEILEKFKTLDRLCLQMVTGAGKTITFSFLAKKWIEQKGGKVLILCHREELVQQSAEVILKLGMTYEKVLPTTKRLHHASDVYIAMIETLDRRLKKNHKYLKDVSLLIADECHVMVFPKVYSFFNEAKILGVTATPVLMGRDTFYKCDRCNATSDELDECCGREMMEWSKPKRMSDIYHDIVVGPSVEYLIEIGQLVKEINFIKHYADTSLLKTDASGEFSNESQERAFGNSESIFNVVLNYEQICKGKRTIVFNNSTKTNRKVYEQFLEKGYNVKLYDSVNDSGESRKQIVKWFRETPDAILCNCGVFVAGLDVKEIEAEILNLATTSLSRYIQMVGRIVRSSDKIYKPHAILIDGGGNVERFNAWSDPNRDWRKIFFEGIGKEKAKQERPLSVQECKQCGMLFTRSESTCPNCGWKVPMPEKRERVLGDEILAPIDKIPLPNGKKIIDYTLSRGEGKAFAFKVLTEQIIDLFRFNLVTRGTYLNTKKNGRLQKRLGEIIRPVYFAFINQPEFKDGANRTLKRVIEDVQKKLDKYYGID